MSYSATSAGSDKTNQISLDDRVKARLDQGLPIAQTAIPEILEGSAESLFSTRYDIEQPRLDFPQEAERRFRWHRWVERVNSRIRGASPAAK